jgi:hypothetical protein
MTKIIETPEEIGDVFFEGELEPEPDMGGPVEPPGEGARPRVTLGQPICLGKFGVDFKAHHVTAAMRRQNDYYLLRLACSFRPLPEGKWTFAALSAYLRPTVGEAPVIAFDLFPQEVTELQEGEITVGVKPDLSLGQVVKIGLGGVETVIKYRRLEPVIIGVGAQCSDPGWEFSAHARHPLLGNRFLYLIVQKPHQAPAVRLSLHLTAQVETARGRFKSTLRRRDKDHLSLVVCAD